MRSLLLVLLVAFAVRAQVTVISIDTSLVRNMGKPLWASLALSAVLPGSGERYLGEKHRARPFFIAEGTLWAATAVTWFAGEAQMRSMREYARRHAGFYPPSDPDVLDIVANYRSRSGSPEINANPDDVEDWDQAQLRAGLVPAGELDANYSWDWGTTENPSNTVRMQEFQGMLRNWRFTRIALQVSAGALVLNRAISMADVLRIHRATAVGNFAFALEPVLGPQDAGANLRVVF